MDGQHKSCFNCKNVLMLSVEDRGEYYPRFCLFDAIETREKVENGGYEMFDPIDYTFSMEHDDDDYWDEVPGHDCPKWEFNPNSDYYEYD